MNISPNDFLTTWRKSFIDEETRHILGIEDMLVEIMEDADEAGISREELDKAALGNLRLYLVAAIKRRTKELDSEEVLRSR